jgi:hypothetical protein
MEPGGAHPGGQAQGFVARMTRGVLMLWRWAPASLVILAGPAARAGWRQRRRRTPTGSRSSTASATSSACAAAWLLVADGPVVPMTWDCSPIVLLPPTPATGPRRAAATCCCTSWRTSTLRLADAILAQLACALYWFQPLAWVACKALRRERKRPATTTCCSRAARRRAPSTCSRRDHARRRLHRQLHAALAMARRSQLEGSCWRC